MPQRDRESMRIISVHLPPNVINLIDALVESGVYPNRSEFVRSAVIEKLATIGAFNVVEIPRRHKNAEEDINVIVPQFAPELKLEDAKDMRVGDAVYAMMPPCYIQSTALMDAIRNAQSQNPGKALYAMLRRHHNDVDIINVGNLVFYRRLDAVGDWRTNPLCREHSLEAYISALTRAMLYILSSVRTQRVCVRMRTLAQAVATSVRSANDTIPHAIMVNPTVRLNIARFTAKLLGIYDGELISKRAVVICLRKP